MTPLSTLEYPHWLIVTGALLLALGFVRLALRQRGVDAPRRDSAINEEPSEPEAELSQVEEYNRTAKERRKARWAETPSEEVLDAEQKTQQLT
jgi:hypothetical protein